MGFAFARARRDTWLLTRMEAEESGQVIIVEVDDAERQDAEPEPGHRYGETCACTLRGE